MRKIQFIAAIIMWLAFMAATAYTEEPVHNYFTTADGIKIHYMTLGEKGSWVVLLHGMGDSAQRMFFMTGIAPELAKNHRVVAFDHRNHGKSGKEASGQRMGRPEDAIELMNHLKINKAHIYGYSMGGGFTGTLLAWYPERFITAIFGGSGIWEYDQKQHDHAVAMDQALAARSRNQATETQRRRIPPSNVPSRNQPSISTQAGTEDPHPLAPVPAARPHSRTPIDLYTVNIPVMAINGSLDTPFVKTQRMFRELRDFTSVILDGHTHVSAIAGRDKIPQMHIDSLVRFINGNDPITK